MDPDPGPAIFAFDLQEAYKKSFLLINFEGIFTSFSKDKKVKRQ
jgi:hypothetical protein